jgi:hypothetical protein
MDSFVVSQNNLKRMSYAKCVTLLERGSHAVRFSFMPGGEVTGLKTYRGPKRKAQLDTAVQRTAALGRFLHSIEPNRTPVLLRSGQASARHSAQDLLRHVTRAVALIDFEVVLATNFADIPDIGAHGFRKYFRCSTDDFEPIGR